MHTHVLEKDTSSTLENDAHARSLENDTWVHTEIWYEHAHWRLTGTRTNLACDERPLCLKPIMLRLFVNAFLFQLRQLLVRERMFQLPPKQSFHQQLLVRSAVAVLGLCLFIRSFIHSIDCWLWCHGPQINLEVWLDADERTKEVFCQDPRKYVMEHDTYFPSVGCTRVPFVSVKTLTTVLFDSLNFRPS